MIQGINPNQLRLQKTADPFNEFDVEFNNAVDDPAMAPEVQGASFGDILGHELQQVQATQNESERLAFDFATGKPVDIHTMMIAAAKADVAMQVTSAVVTKVASGAQTLFQMQV
jgi:flagellar hook-basal body complex protein FliE